MESTTSKKINTLLAAGLVSSLIAMFTGLGLFGYVGMVMGIIALKQLNKTPAKGKGAAGMAIVLGFIYGIGMSIINWIK